MLEQPSPPQEKLALLPRQRAAAQVLPSLSVCLLQLEAQEDGSVGGKAALT